MKTWVPCWFRRPLHYVLSWKTLRKSERIHRLIICCLLFTPKPLSDLPYSYFNLMPVHTSLHHTVRFQRPGKGLRKRSGHERWDGRGSWLSSIYAQGETTSPLQTGSTRLKEWLRLFFHWCWNQFVQGQLLQRQLVNIPNTSGYAAFEQTILPSF